VDAPEPLYPPDAFQEGVAGDVVLDLDIDDEGVVQRALVKASPDPRLAWAALGAVTNMEFLPARQGVQSIFVRIEYKLSFTIDEVMRERMLAEEEARRLAEKQETAPTNLRGRVLVAGERLAVAGAFVSVEGTELETLTGEDGSFELRGVPEGARVIHVEASGYMPGDITEDIQSNVLVDANIFLVRRPGAQDETIVYARRTEREVTKRVLTQKELQRVPGTFGDAIRVVQRLPGVARAPFGLGALLIRGGAPGTPPSSSTATSRASSSTSARARA
jgi:TonB family protein